MCQVIQLSDYIPRKPADRVKTHAFTAHLAERDVSELPNPGDVMTGHKYNCANCNSTIWLEARARCAVYCTNCSCGAEMRPVEAK